jgi:FkbM family methyltransferase
VGRLGYDIVRRRTGPIERPYVGRRARWLRDLDVDVVLDVGANAGQYASEIRSGGYRGTIVSFEPLSSAFTALERIADADPDWQCLQVALGARVGQAELNVSGYSESSSLLPMDDRHVAALPISAYVGRETVSVTTLDLVSPPLVADRRAVWLKLDVQGYETQVLEGARDTLARCVGLECELSLVPLYQGQALGHDVVALLAGFGFRAVAVEEGFTDPASGETLQLNVIFLRDTAAGAG